MPNPPILSGSTKSTWNVTKAGTAAGIVHLFTSADASRVDLVDPPSANVVMIGRDGKVWKRAGDRDVDLASLRVAGHIQMPEAVLPSLLLPFLDHPPARVELANGRLFKYSNRFGSAVYHKDAELLPKKIEILSGGIRYKLERESMETKEHDPAIFALRT